MPAEGSVAAQPGLRSIAAPWLAASTAESPVWRVTAEIPRGRFKAGTEEQRLADLNALATLFRQPFLLHLPDLCPHPGAPSASKGASPRSGGETSTF